LHNPGKEMPNFLDEHDGEIETLAQTFITFPNVTKGKIFTWLRQFEEEHKPVALKLLKEVIFYDSAKILGCCIDLYSQARRQLGEEISKSWILALGNAGKSGDEMLHKFRQANNLHTRNFDHLFKYKSEIASLGDSFSGNLIFIDDFIGSGRQATTSLLDITAVVPKAKITLLVLAGYEDAVRTVVNETGCTILPVNLFSESSKLFSDRNTLFNSEEKGILKNYCQRTGSKIPYGYHDTST